jgi:transketolase
MGHIAPSLSCADIIQVIWENFPKDKLVISKGHGCYALYVLRDRWGTGCLEGFGSLGHGLPIAVGNAFGNKLLENRTHTYCIVGDGEMQEGSNWESLNFMAHHQLDNITVIVDNNGLQAMDKIDNVLSQDLGARFAGWGFNPIDCDGHNYMELLAILKSKPQIVIAKTIKGKGVPEMEGVAKWHYRLP